MFRFVEIEVPPNTTEAEPVSVPIELRHGVITRWWAGFPPGCSNNVHLAVYHFARRILPRDEKESLYWDDYVFEIPDSYQLTAEPYVIEVRGWSTAGTYTYTPLLGVALEPIAEVTAEGLLQRMLTAFVGGG
jgi:hypothetical protein